MPEKRVRDASCDYIDFFQLNIRANPRLSFHFVRQSKS